MHLYEGDHNNADLQYRVTYEFQDIVWGALKSEKYYKAMVEFPLTYIVLLHFTFPFGLIWKNILDSSKRTESV